MHKLIEIDRIIRVIISIIYRLIILGYAFIIIANYPNYFPTYYYYIYSSFYSFIFLLLFNKKNWYSELRTINDFVFIGIILFSKPLDYINYLFLLFPLLNYFNHSDNKRSLSIYIYYTTVLLIFNNGKVIFLDYLPIIFLGFTERFEYYRSKLKRFNSFLLESFDQFSEKNLKLNKTHLIYRDLISKLNYSDFRKICTIQNIYCFNTAEGKINKLYITNASEYIFTFKFKLSGEEIKKLNSQVIYNKGITINEKKYSETIVFEIPANNMSYYYCIAYENPKLLRRFMKYYVNYFLKPFFSKTAIILSTEKELKAELASNINKIKDKLLYVNKAVLAMHSLRNKMQPLVTYFEILPLLDSEKDPNIKKGLKKYMESNLKLTKPSIKEILERTDKILDKTENPFLVTDIKTYTMLKLYHILRTIWQEDFDPDLILFNWDIPDTENVYFDFSLEYIEIVFSNIIDNMLKHSVGDEGLGLVQENGKYKIVFSNNFNTNETDELKKLVNAYNTNKTDEIFKRINKHGMSMVKSFLEQMKIDNNMEINGDKLHLTLTFQHSKFIK